MWKPWTISIQFHGVKRNRNRKKWVENTFLYYSYSLHRKDNNRLLSRNRTVCSRSSKSRLHHKMLSTKTVNTRTIEISQRDPILKVNYCLNVKIQWQNVTPVGIEPEPLITSDCKSNTKSRFRVKHDSTLHLTTDSSSIDKEVLYRDWRWMFYTLALIREIVRN